MAEIYIVPSWFFGVNIALEILFGIITFLLAAYAFKLYNLSNEKEIKILGYSFSFISLSYFIVSIVNFIFLSISQNNTRLLMLEEIINLKNTLILTYLLFLIIGYVTLLYITFHKKTSKTYLIILATTLIGVFFSKNLILTIYLFIALFLFFISYHYLMRCIKNKNEKTFMIFLGFASLFLSALSLIFVSKYHVGNAYVFSHIFDFIGYTLILLSLLFVLKNGKKKK